MYRNTYALINKDIIRNNVKEITTKYNDYKYYIGVVKNNAYHHGIKCVIDMAAAGINYFAVSSLEEALELRKYNLDTPILILEPIDCSCIYDCINNNITITVESLNYIRELKKQELSYELKIHLKLDTGMNRLGFKNRLELEKSIELIKETKNMVLEGIYTHFATSGVIDKEWDNQLKRFEELTQNINLKEIPIVHMGRSLTLVNHPKIKFCNGIRLGIIMYGFAQSKKEQNDWRSKLRKIKQNYIRKKYQISETTLQNDLKLKTAFSLFSTIISIRYAKKDDVIGYNAKYKMEIDGYLATIPIGYADGVDKNFKIVCINQRFYPIVADSMDMITVLVDESVKMGMRVEIFGENISVAEVAYRIQKNAYHLFNQIQNRVPRVHITELTKEETKY